ncbi:hypothetical protein EV424DRAFT_1557514, partial [Suillus variegatus]
MIPSPYRHAIMKVVGLAVLVFDYCIKLEAEISLTWGRKWDFIRILFVVARYTPFVDVPVDLIYSLGPTSSHVCLSLYQVISWFNVFSTIAAECNGCPSAFLVQSSPDIQRSFLLGH